MTSTKAWPKTPKPTDGFMTRIGSATLAVALCIGALASPAGAAPSTATTTPKNPTLGIPEARRQPGPDAAIEDKRAWCRFEVERRHIKVDLLGNQLATARSLKPDHRRSLEADLVQTATALDELDASLVSEADRAALDQRCAHIRTELYVFSLKTPQQQLVMGADAVSAAADELERSWQERTLEVEQAAAAGNPNAGVARALAIKAGEAAPTARRRVEGMAEAVLALTPADRRNRPELLVPFQQQLRSARADLREGRAALAEAAAVLDAGRVPPKRTPKR